MGQQFSMTRKNRRKSHKLFNSQNFLNRNHTISHTFAVFDEEPSTDLININLACENDLLKVRDIDLELAKNIIKHRKTIGYYQRVEDLVVVPGMGAERLNRIRHQVCCVSKNVMRSSCQSVDSLRTIDSRTTISKWNKLVNINIASIYELQSVHGITQEIAAAIVHYRNKRGLFKKLDDLRKIKCIDNIRLDNISRYLTVDNDEDSISDVDTKRLSYDLSNFAKIHEGNLKYISTNGVTNGSLSSTLTDIFELLSAYSPRPIVREIFKYSRNDQAAFRIASWNLENFTLEKASNLGVREVVCRTILENGWSILAVQNVEDDGALKLICDELNKPKLRRVEEWKYNSTKWRCIKLVSKTAKLGFIYDSKGVNETNLTSTEKGPPSLEDLCEIMISNFQIGSVRVQILNLQVQNHSNLAVLRDFLQEVMNSYKNCLICGDFGSPSSDLDFFASLDNSKIILSSLNLLNHVHSTNSFPKHCTSNVLLNASLQKHHTGLNGIVRHGLTHLAIPSGWSWGGPVSAYCPVWVEFFIHCEVNS